MAQCGTMSPWQEEGGDGMPNAWRLHQLWNCFTALGRHHLESGSESMSGSVHLDSAKPGEGLPTPGASLSSGPSRSEGSVRIVQPKGLMSQKGQEREQSGHR